MNYSKRFPLLLYSLLLSGFMVGAYFIFEKVYFKPMPKFTVHQSREIASIKERMKRNARIDQETEDRAKLKEPSSAGSAYIENIKDPKTGVIMAKTHLPKGKRLYNEEKMNEVSESANISDTD
jgi:phage terminase large subunit-like protein